ncbi:hypothetical protein [Actinoplanes subtropicus]|uniref:hypothetical protein n=1 Tax=Actinoplanes subtropicus TaxID=543632 RepID=UPI0012FCF56B|nr:hypothetical protein [Actinoplanes subtropicus]
MTTADDLLGEVRRLLRTTGTPYASAAEAHDIYEAYLLSLVVSVARDSQATVSYATVDGTPTTNLVFRTSPGMIYSTALPYTHAVIDFPGAPTLEAHVGVRVQGRSRVLHECDVLVLSQEEADRARGQQVAPRGGRSLLAIECKFYTSNLKLGQARGFEGLHADLGTRHTLFVANLNAVRVARYLNARRRIWEQTVRPGAQQVTHVETLIREAFKDHCARHGQLLP